LPKGEQKMLADRKLRQYVQELYLPRTTAHSKDPGPPQKSPTAKTGRPAGRPTDLSFSIPRPAVTHIGA